MASRFISIAIIVIIIASAGVYINTLTNDFVYDDLFQVLKNKWIKDIRNIPDIFISSVWSFEKWPLPSNYYRPMMHLIYMVDYNIFGLEPWGWHLVNVIFHSGVTVLVFLVAYNLFNQSAIRNPKSQILNSKSEILYPAFIASLLFATHPIHTEAVAWVGGIPELSCAFFYLLSFYLYARSTANGQQIITNWYNLFAIISYFLSLLSKEPAITLPLLLIFYDCLVRKESLTPFRPWIKRYLPYLLVSIIYILLRTYALEGIAPLRQKYPSFNFFQSILNAFPLFIGYFRKLLFPVNLNAFYTFHPVYSLFEKKSIISLTITFLLILFLYSLRKKREILFNSLLVILPLLPVLYAPVLGKNPFTERYLYLPSVGFVILTAIALKNINRFAASNPRVTIYLSSVIVGIVIVLYSIVTVERNTVWKDEYTLWTDTVKKSPDSSIVHYNLGIVYAEKKLLDKAIGEFKEAIKISPRYTDAYFNLALMYDEKGLTELAVVAYKMALRLDPKSADAHYNLGLIYMKNSMFDQAILEFEEALKIKPDYKEAQQNLNRALYLKSKARNPKHETNSNEGI